MGTNIDKDESSSHFSFGQEVGQAFLRFFSLAQRGQSHPDSSDLLFPLFQKPHKKILYCILDDLQLVRGLSKVLERL